jgi:hypothetical protein
MIFKKNAMRKFVTVQGVYGEIIDDEAHTWKEKCYE